MNDKEIMEDELSKRRTKNTDILDSLERNLDAINEYPYHETMEEIDGVCFLCEEYFLSEQFTSYQMVLTRFRPHKKTFKLCKSCAKWNKSRPKKRMRRRNRTHEEIMADIEKNGERVRRNILQKWENRI